MRKIVTSVVCLLWVFALHAQKPDDLFNKGNELFKKNQFDSAIVCYQKIIETGYESADVYFNMGNAFFKTKDLSKCILYYEKARKLNPNDDEINFNLQLAQTMIVDKINILPDFFLKQWLYSIINLQTSDNWAYWGIVSFILTLIFLLIYLISKSLGLKKTFFWLSALTLLIAVFSFAESYKQKKLYEAHDTAIVQTASVTIKSSPDEKGNDLFVIHEGSKVTIIDEVGEWREIKISDGNKGWLKLSDIELI
jgi:tetratricopeptide (TPR) repeat protein